MLFNYTIHTSFITENYIAKSNVFLIFYEKNLIFINPTL